MQENFDQWFDTANDFLVTFQFDFDRGKLSKAAFELHQSAERYFTAILLTFTDYRPKEHDLASLNSKAIACDKRFAEVFPQETQEQKDRFRLLVRAYIDARYRMKQYYITHEDLEYLGKRVELLRSLTEETCKKRIAAV